MSDVTNAADSLLQFVERLKPLQDVADALKKIGSLNQAIEEKTAAHVAAIEKHLNLTNDIAAAETELSRLKAAGQTAISEAEDAVRDQINRARQEAEVILVAARRDADELRMVATNDAVITKNAAKSTLDALETRAATARADLNDWLTRLENTKQEHAAVTTAITEMKTKAKSLLS